LLAALLLALAACGSDAPAPNAPEPTAAPAPVVAAPPAPPSFVGGTACAGCHADAAKAWAGSHHDLAMQVADETTVLGDFGDATFRKDGVATRFFRRDGGYWVHTDGADGKLADFRIAYTFGVDPLQQYLIEFPDGRMQALTIVWDTRPRAQGGQRWFHLQGDEKVPAGDVLHWTGPAQNWNHMCAECHSTRLVKGYDEATDSFKTSWSEIDVSCEACHGPGSRHVEWAGRLEADRAAIADRGLVFALRGHEADAWQFAPGAAIAHRARPLPDRSELETCGRCHSRRGQIWGEYRHGQPLAQTHRVALLDDGLYHADGQIQDEVYEYGSFVQSPMHAAGVTCSDCHEPHSLRLRAEGNAVCARCHLPARYDMVEHHRHPQALAAQQCVSCHMIERTYMGVDGRRDHGFRVPRPDLSVRLGTPNACSDCHAKAGAEWAARKIEEWHGPERAGKPRYAAALAAGRAGSPDAAPQLLALVADATQPPIARATALELLATVPARLDPALARAAAADPDPLVRRAAANLLRALPPEAAVQLAGGALSDPVRSVRLEAVDSVLDLPPGQLDPSARGALDRTLAEYRDAQRLNGDRAEGHLNLGALALRQGDAVVAEREFRLALARQPQFVPARVNLADALRVQGREPEAEAELRAALALVPDSGDVHHALGMALVRQRRYDEALATLGRAAQLQPAQPQYAYVYAIALHDTGDAARALRVLAGNVARHPADAASLMALAQYSAESGDRDAALRWAAKLSALRPGDPEVTALVRSLMAD
jgi:Tfp pilus assembly protein PilF